MKYKQYNDYELIYMVRENETVSDVLFKKYEPILRNISKQYYQDYKYYGYDYDDFLQEAYVLFNKALVNYNEERNNLFYSFVVLCVNRGMLTFCKRISNSNKNIASFYCFDINEKEIPDSTNDIDNLLVEYDFRKNLKEIIYNMSMDYGAVLELKINGFNYREIAILLDVSDSTIEYRSKKIRRIIGDKYCKKAN